MRNFFALLLIITMLASLSGCQKNYYNPDQPTPQKTQSALPAEIESIALAYQSLTLHIGEAIQMTYEISPIDAQEKSVLLQSSNDSIAAISESGVLCAKKEGVATITARSENDETIAVACEITVLPLRKAIITSNAPLWARANSSFSIKVAFENCSNPSVKIIGDCKGGIIEADNDTIEFDNTHDQVQVMGEASIKFTMSGSKQVNSVRVLCFDNGALIDSKEITVGLVVEEAD